MTSFGVWGPKCWEWDISEVRIKIDLEGRDVDFFSIFLQKPKIYTLIFNIYQFGDRYMPFLDKKVSLKLKL